MIYIVDHQDRLLGMLSINLEKFDKVYCSNYFDINKKMLDKSNSIVLSPGPGSLKITRQLLKFIKIIKKKKIIGICLGYQQILFK